MRRWFILGVRKLIVKSQPFQQQNTGSSWNKKPKKRPYLNQLNVSKPLMVSISQKREDPTLYIIC
jgi:hypothetical protein